MSLADRVAPAQGESLWLEYDLPHPPEKVWRALTEPALLTEWLLPVADLQLEQGAAFTFRTQPHPGWDGTVRCRFVEIEPQRKLSYRWSVPFLETIVTFTLTPTASGTHLSIAHAGFAPTQKREFGGARYGWKMMSDRLVDLLARSA